MGEYEAIRARLRERAAVLQRRVGRIRDHLRHAQVPLERDFAEQATQRENEEVLEGLDSRGRQELAELRAALERLDAGSYGTCAGCGESIPVARLEAMPTATLCVGCAGR
jgi:RNA polymerase-binding protein DksA